jgi:hypothetical protein
MSTTTDALEAARRAAGARGRVASASAIEAVYRSQAARFRGLAAAVAGADAASDVVQDAFAHALRRRATWRGDGPLEACSGGSSSTLREMPNAGAFDVSDSPLGCSACSSGTPLRQAPSTAPSLSR